MERKVIVQFEFAENLSFVAIKSAQAFHCYNEQASVFTIVIYSREDSQLKHCSMAIVVWRYY